MTTRDYHEIGNLILTTHLHKIVCEEKGKTGVKSNLRSDAAGLFTDGRH